MKTSSYGSTTKSIGDGQKLKSDSGPRRMEETTNYNPAMKKGGESMKDTGLSRTISSGAVPSLQGE